jgi:hypothetical protein
LNEGWSGDVFVTVLKDSDDWTRSIWRLRADISQKVGQPWSTHTLLSASRIGNRAAKKWATSL